MSRRNQDIPIRPRYGIPDMANNDEEVSEERSRPRTRKPSASVMEASSYSEIPFLAQYPDADATHSDTTGSPVADAFPEDDPAGEHEDDEEDNSNSRDSSCDESKTPRRPNSLQCDTSFPYELESATSSDGQMRHFVADNLEEKLRNDQLSYASHNSTPSTATGGGGPLTRRYLQTQHPQIDANVLDDIEIEAQYLATSVDNLNENLCNLLHSISSITADNVEAHKNAVNKLTDSMDANIKCMYTIMAKTEEITKSMPPTEMLGQRMYAEILKSKNNADFLNVAMQSIKETKFDCEIKLIDMGNEKVEHQLQLQKDKT